MFSSVPNQNNFINATTAQKISRSSNFNSIYQYRMNEYHERDNGRNKKLAILAWIRRRTCLQAVVVIASAAETETVDYYLGRKYTKPVQMTLFRENMPAQL